MIMDKNRLGKILRNSISGRINSDDDSAFAEAMFKHHREEYTALHKEIKEEEIRRINPMYGNAKS